jgi:hypothetical protein
MADQYSHTTGVFFALHFFAILVTVSERQGDYDLYLFDAPALDQKE